MAFPLDDAVVVHQPVKVGGSWAIHPKGEGWVFDKTFPTKWKAALALETWTSGGRVSDYWVAARAEQTSRRATGPHVHPASPATHDDVSLQGAAVDHDRSSALARFGSAMALEARAWAIEGPDSALPALRQALGLRHPPSTRLKLELFALHLAAFVEATFRFDADGMALQVGMVQAMVPVARGIFELDGEAPPDEQQLRQRVSDALSSYVGSAPRAGTTDEIARFAAYSASRVLDLPETSMAADFMLYRTYESAREQAALLMAELFAQ